MFLVTGGTGNVGREVAAALAAAGEPVRALARSGAPADAPDGVEYVTGDLNRPDTLAPALQGVRGLFLLPGYDGTAELLAEAGRAGAEHVVLLSGSSAESGDTATSTGAPEPALKWRAIAFWPSAAFDCESTMSV